MNRFVVMPRRALPRLLFWLLVDLVLLALLALLVWFDNAANRGIAFRPDPLPIPYADGPRLGVNAFNLHLEPDRAVVTRTLELARAMGAGYVRMQLPWEDLEIHGPGDFTDRRNDLDGDGQKDAISAWAKYDLIVNTADQLGLELVLRLERPPDWARPAALADPAFQEGLRRDGNSTGPPDDLADYGRFVGAVVQRYRGKVRFYQLWNEPNLKNEWNWREPRPEEFVALLRAGYTAARAADPAAVILFPSLAPTDGLDVRAPMTELEYLERVYQAGGGAYFDIMSGQAYGLGQSPAEHRYVFLRGRANWVWRRPIDTRNDVSRIVLLREVMERNGDERKPVWIGEFGWNSAPESIAPERRFTWGAPVSEATKAEYLVGQLERARDEWPWVGVMHVWMLRYGGYAEPDAQDPTPYFALVGRDWQLLPAYERLRAYSAGPAVAGVGAHSWQHRAVEPIDGGWRVRFSGTGLTLVGGAGAAPTVLLDGAPLAMVQGEQAGRRTLRTPRLADGLHTLELQGGPAPQWFIVERMPPWPWFWPAALGLVLAALAAAGAATMLAFCSSLDQLAAWWSRATGGVAFVRGALFIQLGMLAGLLIGYRLSAQLPLTLAGLALFGGLALARPDLALRFVPLTAPLYFMPKGIWDARFGIRDEGLRFPLHELVLIITLGATAAHLLWPLIRRLFEGVLFPAPSNARRATGRGMQAGAGPAGGLAAFLRSNLPIGLFVLAGTLGLLVAGERGPALREWRWLIIEPLLFYGLARYWAQRTLCGAQHYWPALTASFLAGGALVGLVGLLQFAGLNLVPLIGQKVGFSDDQILVEGVRRVTSVYGHPNNLGLYLGRVWPLAAALLAGAGAGRLIRLRKPEGLFYAGCTLLALGGLLVSFSRGAWLGALAAGLVLVLRLGPAGQWRSRRWRLGLGLAAGLLLGGLAIAIGLLGIERFNPFGESSAIRLKTWLSALRMLADYPLFGVGLDQFGRLYPQYIDPNLAGTNEINTAHPHNLLLDILLRTGWLGLAAFGWLNWRLLRRAAAGAGPLSAGLMAAGVAALVHGLVDSYYFWPDLAFAFWLLLALAEAQAPVRKTSLQTSSS